MSGHTFIQRLRDKQRLNNHPVRFFLSSDKRTLRRARRIGGDARRTSRQALRQYLHPPTRYATTDSTDDSVGTFLAQPPSSAGTALSRHAVKAACIVWPRPRPRPLQDRKTALTKLYCIDTSFPRIVTMLALPESAGSLLDCPAAVYYKLTYHLQYDADE
jgi:hypothetical protein